MLQLSKEQSNTGLAISVIAGFVNDQNCKFVYFLLEAVSFVNSWFKLVIILLYVNRPTLNKIIYYYYYYYSIFAIFLQVVTSHKICGLPDLQTAAREPARSSYPAR